VLILPLRIVDNYSLLVNAILSHKTKSEESN
jgi:hypothetical protein